MKRLTIVVSFDVGEQLVPGGIPGWVLSVVDEFGFQSAEATSRRQRRRSLCPHSPRGRLRNPNQLRRLRFKPDNALTSQMDPLLGADHARYPLPERASATASSAPNSMSSRSSTSSG